MAFKNKDFINQILNKIDFMYIRAMKFLNLVLCFSVGMIPIFCQKELSKIPRKLRGYYEGTQPSYAFVNQTDSIFFSEIGLILNLEKDKLKFCYSGLDYCPVASLPFQKMYWAKEGKEKIIEIRIKTPNSQLVEEFRVYKKQKKIVRRGVYPQPDSELKYLRKKQ